MPDPQIQDTVQDTKPLVDLIKRSEIIGDFEKEDFINLLPRLTKDQFDEIMNFFSSAEREINDKKRAYAEKENQLYAPLIQKLNESFQEAKKVVYKGKEEISTKSEGKTSEKLLEELNNI